MNCSWQERTSVLGTVGPSFLKLMHPRMFFGKGNSQKASYAEQQGMSGDIELRAQEAEKSHLESKLETNGILYNEK